MEERSVLLKYLIDSADEMKCPENQKAVSANQFFAMLLQVLTLYELDKLPPVLQEDSVRRELDEINKLLEPYEFDRATAGDVVLEAIAQPKYPLHLDEHAFRSLTLQLRFQKKPDEQLLFTAVAYTERIIKSPTSALSKILFAAKPCAEEAEEDGQEEEADKAQSAQDTQDTEQGDDFGFVVAPAGAEPGARVRRSARPQKRGEEKLADVVQSTKDIRATLKAAVFGQDHAIDAVAAGYFRSQIEAKANSGSKKPKSLFLFAGPPGVGKTFLAEKIAEALKLPYRRFDMSEYAD